MNLKSNNPIFLIELIQTKINQPKIKQVIKDMSKSCLPVLILKLDVYWRIWFTKQLEDLQVLNLIVERTVLRSSIISGFIIQILTCHHCHLLVFQAIKTSFTISNQTVINILKLQIFSITWTLIVKQFISMSIYF